jgi:hypothetical protein
MDGARVGALRLRDLVRVADALGVAPVALVPGLAYSAQRFRRQPTTPRVRVRHAPPETDPATPPMH